MINLFAENNGNWDKIFSFIFDVIWNTKFPITNTTIAYFIIFFMVIKLSIYAIHGTSTQYNELGSTVQKKVHQNYILQHLVEFQILYNVYKNMLKNVNNLKLIVINKNCQV